MKIKLFILGMALIGNMAFALATDTSTVKLRALTLPTIIVDDIDFGDYILGEASPANAMGGITLTGTASKDIKLSVSKALELNSGPDKINVTMSLDNGTEVMGNSVSTVTLDGSGDGTSTLTASLDAVPTVDGDYSGTATVIASYN